MAFCVMSTPVTIEHRECRDALCSLQPTNELHQVHISMKKYTEYCKIPNNSEMTQASTHISAFHVHFYRETPCVLKSAFFTVGDVRLSVTFVYCIEMAEDIVKLLSLPGSPPL